MLSRRWSASEDQIVWEPGVEVRSIILKGAVTVSVMIVKGEKKYLCTVSVMIMEGIIIYFGTVHERDGISSARGKRLIII